MRKKFDKSRPILHLIELFISCAGCFT